MIAAILPLVLQSAVAPPAMRPTAPVVLTRHPNDPVPAVDWSCRMHRRGEDKPFTLTGSLPAVAREAQRDGRALGLSSSVRSSEGSLFSGTFTTNLVMNFGDMFNFAVKVEKDKDKGPIHALQFQMFRTTRQGILSIVELDRGGVEKLSAYAAGLCTTSAPKSPPQ